MINTLSSISNMDKSIYLQILSRALLVIGAINYIFIYVFKKNAFNLITTNKTILSFLGIAIGLSGLYYLRNRDFYLPFLAPTYIPFPKDENSTATGKLVNVELVDLPPNVNVIYWASNPSDEIFEDPKEAYKGFGSSGMVKTNEKGTVTFTILCPASYKVKGKVPFMEKTLESHVHYRYEDPSYPGMFSSVKNKFVTC